MNPNTLVALPPITAAQRQTLIAALEHAHKHGYQRVVEVAQALDLHRDAVPAMPPCQTYSRAGTKPSAGNAAPGTVLQCFDCGKRTDEYAGLSCRASHLHTSSS